MGSNKINILREAFPVPIIGISDNTSYRSNKINILRKVLPVPIVGISDNADHGVDVGAIVTNYCISACAHCYNRSGPNGKLEISSEKLHRLIKQGEIYGEKISRIGFSGGEPLLYTDLSRLLKASSQKGIATFIVTGGVGISKNQIKELGSLGVQRLTFSYDSYHSKFISEDKFCSLVNTSAKYLPETAIQIATTSSKEGLKLAKGLCGKISKDVEINVMPITRVGRATKLPEANYFDSKFKDNRKLSDTHKKLIINYDENVYLKCKIDELHERNKVGKLDDLLH